MNTPAVIQPDFQAEAIFFGRKDLKMDDSGSDRFRKTLVNPGLRNGRVMPHARFHRRFFPVREPNGSRRVGASG
jgi:hypothetical protein